VCRRKIVNSIILFDINIIIITPGEYSSRFEMHWSSLGDAVNTSNSSAGDYSSMVEMHWNSLGDAPNSPNSSEICTF